jgi:hypothetical protein
VIAMAEAQSPMRLLAEAQNALGARAVTSAEKGDHRTAATWSQYAVQAGHLMRAATRLAAEEASR